jgi:hypothetical protein
VPRRRTFTSFIGSPNADRPRGGSDAPSRARRDAAGGRPERLGRPAASGLAAKGLNLNGTCADQGEDVLLGQVDSGSDSVVQVVSVLGLAWAVFVIWWMVDMRREVQRIRWTLEHSVYDLSEDEDGEGT